MPDDPLKSSAIVYNSIALTYARQIEEYAPVPERDEFISVLPSQGKILDVGCAAGRDSGYFSSKGFSVVGVDLSGKLLEIARKKFPHIDFFKQDFRSHDFPKESFNGIWACASLLHLKRTEIPAVLRQFFALLKPKGILYIQVKEGKGEKDVVDILSSGQSRHFTFFEIGELKQFLEEAGFRVEKIYVFNEKERTRGH